MPTFYFILAYGVFLVCEESHVANPITTAKRALQDLLVISYHILVFISDLN
jgi:hypothetical protein